MIIKLTYYGFGEWNAATVINETGSNRFELTQASL